MRKQAVLIVCLLLALLGGAFAEEAAPSSTPEPNDPAALMAPLPEQAEGVAPLPVDFTPGLPVLAENYLTDWEYEDPSLHVKVTTGRHEHCDYWIADVRVADASQLRTAAADPDEGFNGEMAVPAVDLARRMNAVLAVNGDYYYYTGWGHLIRQGEMYLSRLKGGRDVLLIDEDGDFHTVRRAKDGMVGTEIEGKRIINAFFFGPVLYENGVLGMSFEFRDMAYDMGAQRMALCQVEPLHYKVICCASPYRGSEGMTLDQFARFVSKQGVRVAYNLDGGNSAAMVFRGAKVNDVGNPNLRDLADIVYFASAWTPPAEE